MACSEILYNWSLNTFYWSLNLFLQSKISSSIYAVKHTNPSKVTPGIHVSLFPLKRHFTPLIEEYRQSHSHSIIGKCHCSIAEGRRICLSFSPSLFQAPVSCSFPTQKRRRKQKSHCNNHDARFHKTDYFQLNTWHLNNLPQ